MLFGGNLIKQPAFVDLRKDNPDAIKIVGEMKGSDQIMCDTIFIGTYPGLTEDMLDKEIRIISEFVRRERS